MTLLFFFKHQPYPPHPYEQREPRKTRKKAAKKKAIKEIERQAPEHLQMLPSPETIAQAAIGRRRDLSSFRKFEGKDWEKILRDALLLERERFKIREDQELIELATIIDMEMSL